MTPEPRLRRPRPRAAGVVACLALACAGCALDEQDHPVPVDPSSSIETNDTTSGRSGIWTTRRVSVFLVHEDRLLRVDRQIVVDPGERPAFAGLVASVSEAESREGLRSALPSPVRGMDLAIRGRTALVQLPKGFDDLDVSEQILGVGQIVFTLTADGTVDKVQFTEGSHNVAVPTGSGRLSGGAVDRSDYAVIAPVGSGP